MITALFMDFTARFTADELFHEGQKRNLVFLPVYDVADLLDDPQLEAGDFWARVDHPEAGPMRYPLGIIYSEEMAVGARPAPTTGQDNMAVYCGELGLSKQELSALRAAGVV